MAWVFIGNFILLNLFLAILLDSFLEDEAADGQNQKFDKIEKMKRKKYLEKRKLRVNANKVLMSSKLQNAIKVD